MGFHLEKKKAGVFFFLRGNALKEDFKYGDKYTFTCVVEEITPKSCLIALASGKIDIAQVKKLFNQLNQMGYEEISWERMK